MLEDENVYVQRVVAEVLGRVATHDDILQLREMLKDKNWDIQRSIAEALEYMDSEESVSLLLDLLDMIISENKNISIIKDKLVLADRKLYCPFNWPDEENQ
jgi:HEAT repeat protein